MGEQQGRDTTYTFGSFFSLLGSNFYVGNYRRNTVACIAAGAEEREKKNAVFIAARFFDREKEKKLYNYYCVIAHSIYSSVTET